MNCFETIGSSTITVFDDQPIIKTDILGLKESLTLEVGRIHIMLPNSK
jgi:hypothetical protein|tara:strand:+ start:5143 stop:5286 length:144 start_codon:yes stop_codon:yes gene_type:complete